MQADAAILSLLLLQAAPTGIQESWLVGGWASGPTSCAAGNDISLERDRTYNDLEGEGVWALVGNQLTVTSTSGDDFGRSDVVQVAVSSRVEIELTWPDGTRAKFYRCSNAD